MVASDPDCIFCKIAAGQIPCHKIYEDEDVLAFLDVNPLSAGHTLVIPKTHNQTLDEVSEDVAAKIGRVLPRLSRAVKQATGINAWNILQNNGSEAHQAVDHVHFHIIPKDADGGLGITWPADQLVSDEAEPLIKLIREALD